MYAIAGVSGNTGKVAAETLLAAGHKVRVIVRDAAKGEAWKKKGADVAIADLSDRDALAAAFRGASGAYVLLPPRWDAADPVAHNKRVADAIDGAARDAGLPHLVLLSSLGAQHADGTGPVKTLYYAEGRMRSLPGFTALRAGYFVENWASVLGPAKSDGVLPTFIAADRPCLTVSTPDIGKKAAELLLAGPSGYRIVELAGPAPTTPNEVASALTTLFGRPVSAAAYPAEAATEALKAAGVPPQWAALYQELYVGLREGRLEPELPAKLARGSESLIDGLRRITG